MKPAILQRLLVMLLLMCVCGHAAEPHHIAIYAPGITYQVDIVVREGAEYVGLTDLLEPLGRLESRADGKKIKLSFNGLDAEFQDGKRQFKLRGEKQDLSANFAVIDGRGYIPVAALAHLLPRIAELPADFHVAAHRLFLGGAQVRYACELLHAPSRLVLTFTAPVNPLIRVEKGRVRFAFRREAVVGGSPASVPYGDELIQSTAWQESADGFELDVNVQKPVTVIAGGGGRSFTIQAAVAAAPPAMAPRVNAPVAAPNGQSAASSGVVQRPVRTLPFVFLDAAHGGGDAGEMLGASVPEKNVTLALARRLQKELESRGVAVVMSRTSDAQLSNDQRAVAANTSHAVLYVSLHASSSGNGLRIYTAMVPSLPAGQGRQSFLPWDAAQAPSLPDSRIAAAALDAQATSAGFHAQTSSVPLRPLNSVTIAAVAVELAPPPGGSANDLGSAEYQARAAAALADAIAGLRGRLQEAP
ncbi:MAG: N-acetylmuramoyl-L-alanine amidase [Acidobacteriota bacterium]|nr:N-acetylmuramoyl-L-alanine amidase [Acidobacteriota bacterium]